MAGVVAVRSVNSVPGGKGITHLEWKGVLGAALRRKPFELRVTGRYRKNCLSLVHDLRIGSIVELGPSASARRQSTRRCVDCRLCVDGEEGDEHAGGLDDLLVVSTVRGSRRDFHFESD